MSDILIDLGVRIESFVRVMREMFTTRHVYLRELTQNSLEAINSRRQLDSSFRGVIDILTDHRTGVVKVVDDGIGMTPEELSTNLTRLFESGWTQAGGKSLGIGQFGFGFYSVFLVSTQVRVISRSALDGSTPHLWELDFETNQIHITPYPGEHPVGTTVEVHLDDHHREGIDGELIRKTLQETFLYTASPVVIDGQRSGIPTANQWREQLYDSARLAALGDWIRDRHGWSAPPMLVHPLAGECVGWIATGPANPGMMFSIPGVEIFRRGIRVASQELLPKPMNFMMCGLIDAEHLKVKPDREEIQSDAALRGVQRFLIDACGEALERLATNPDHTAALFKHYGGQTMDSIRMHDSARRALIDHLPVDVLDGQRSRKSTLREYLDKRDNRLVWTKDPLRDRMLVDRATQLHGLVLHLDDREEEILRTHCRERQIPFQPVAVEYLEDLQANAANPAGNPALAALQALFHNELEDATILLARDPDRRFPVQMIATPPQETEELDELFAQLDELDSPAEAMLGRLLMGGMRRFVEERSAGTVVVVNLNNGIIQRMQQLLEGSDAKTGKALRQAARTGIFLARLQAGSTPTPDEVVQRIEEIWDLIDSRLKKKESKTQPGA